MINMLLAKATDQENEIARLQDCERLCVELSHNIQEMEAKCLASLQKTEVSAWLPLNSTLHISADWLNMYVHTYIIHN